MKGSLTLKILQTISEMGVEAIDLCEAIVIAGYGASDFRIRQIQERKYEERLKDVHKRSLHKPHVRNYQKLLAKLKAQGLLRAEEKEGRDFFFITARGKSKLTALESRLTSRLRTLSYRPSPSERPLIVSFDIPEKQRAKRGWMREALKRLGLKMVHQSVWIGMVKLPKDFLDELKELNLTECIEIFEVGKSGTLRNIA